MLTELTCKEQDSESFAKNCHTSEMCDSEKYRNSSNCISGSRTISSSSRNKTSIVVTDEINLERAQLAFESTQEFPDGGKGTQSRVGNNFLRGFRFSPDGSCALTNSDDNTLRLFDMSNLKTTSSVLRVREGETIYDFCWYPSMHYARPASCCFLTTSRDAPIHLWDAYRGHLRATYRSYDHLDAITSAVSVRFDPSGQKIFCGFERMIRIFDVSRPGRSCEERPTCKTKRSRFGQRGLLSCIDFSKDHTGMYAVGSYARSTAIYSDRNGGEVLCELRERTGAGVTQIRFAGHHLFVGSRKGPYITCWDVRSFRGELCCFPRRVLTNQRVGFDVDSSGKYILTGSTQTDVANGEVGGSILLYSTSVAPSSGIDGHPISSPLSMRSNGFRDTVNDVQFHPTSRMFGAATGQRHFNAPGDGCSAVCKVDRDETKNESPVNRNALSLWKY